jgi:1-acyl-sn-glycerol-3-phosphate acyltransferase
MEEWRFEPARDLGLTRNERRLSLRREVGLEGAISCLAWRTLTRSYLALAHRWKIHGRENLPTHPPFVLIANHASHLDAVVLGAMLPARFAGSVFPIAAGDTFFTKSSSSIFATAWMNALPIWRKNCGAHSLEELRARLLRGESVYILFPEGTRTRDGDMAKFKPGLGRLVAGAKVPIVPCYLKGTFESLPATRSFPQPKRISVVIGEPLVFSGTTNDRQGWELIAATLEDAVRRLSEESQNA